MYLAARQRHWGGLARSLARRRCPGEVPAPSRPRQNGHFPLSPGLSTSRSVRHLGGGGEEEEEEEGEEEEESYFHRPPLHLSRPEDMKMPKMLILVQTFHQSRDIVDETRAMKPKNISVSGSDLLFPVGNRSEMSAEPLRAAAAAAGGCGRSILLPASSSLSDATPANVRRPT